MQHDRNIKAANPSWMQGFIPKLDKRNPHVTEEVKRAVQRAQAARDRYLAACERVQRTLAH